MHAKPFGNKFYLIRAQVTFFDGLNLTLDLAQVEKQLLLVGRGAHLNEGPGPQDKLLNGGLDPPHGIGGKFETLVWLKSLHRLHEANVAF